MQELFESNQLKGISLGNRFVYSATWDGLADSEGGCTERNIDALVERAHGGVGLIITGMAFVNLEGKAGPGQLAACADDFVPGLAGLATAIHDAGGKIVLQLAHGGCYSAAALTCLDVLGPSANSTERFPPCQEMQPLQIKRVVESFAKAAGRAKKAGFDGVQLHAAHGYLLNQFLSPFFNKRKDMYGGSIGNRARLLLESVQAVKNEVGKDFPVLVKINSEDFLEGGLTVEEMLEVCSMLEEAGIDAIEMSGGTVYAPGTYSCSRVGVTASTVKESYYADAAARYKAKIAVPLILVGGIRSLEAAEELIGAGVADYVALSRPLIREAALIRRWKDGDKRASTCLSCNGCFGPGIKGEGVRCIVNGR